MKRLWRAKSKHHATSLEALDVDQDGQLELVTGWESGKVEARNPLNGEVLFKETLPSPVMSLCTADYRLDGRLLDFHPTHVNSVSVYSIYNRNCEVRMC